MSNTNTPTKLEASIIENFVEKPKALFIFAHGAGADKSHSFMEDFTARLNEQHINVVRFNFPYMDKRLTDGKKYPPNRMPALLSCYEDVLCQYINNNTQDLPLFMGGKSMGGRVAAMLSSTEILSGLSITQKALQSLKGVVCLGYPFHPAKKPEKLRLEPLQETSLPTLILQGDRDSLGSKEEIESYTISPLCEVFYFEDGDHDLKPRVKSGYKHEQHLQSAVFQLTRFIHEQS